MATDPLNDGYATVNALAVLVTGKVNRNGQDLTASARTRVVAEWATCVDDTIRSLAKVADPSRSETCAAWRTEVLEATEATIGGVEYPATDGTAGQVLTTDGAGTATWEDPAGGSGDVYELDFTSAGSVTISDGSNTIDGLTWTAANTAATTTFAVGGTGLRIVHGTSSTDFSGAGGETCPTLSVKLRDVLPNWKMGQRIRVSVKLSSLATINANFEIAGVAVSHPNTNPPTGGVAANVGMGRGYNGAAQYIAYRRRDFLWFANGDTTDLVIGFDWNGDYVRGWSAVDTQDDPDLVKPRFHALATAHSSGDSIADLAWEDGMSIKLFACTNNTSGALDVSFQSLRVEVL